MKPISDWGTSLPSHMALMTHELVTNGNDERAMPAVAQYVREAAHGHFEFIDDVTCNGRIYNRGASSIRMILILRSRQRTQSPATTRRAQEGNE